LFSNTDNRFTLLSSNGGNINVDNLNILENKKYAARYNSQNLELFIDGIPSSNESTVGFSENTFSKLKFTSGGTSVPFYGRVRQVKHLPYNTDITTL
jgi:hypothetical protein